jgi:uncharacterized damage-inducible protein DinB
MTMELIREIWEYHHWANRKLFDVATALGEPLAGREVGPQFSLPTLRQMFAHIYGADRFWLASWRDQPRPSPQDPTLVTLRELRPLWDALEREQRAWVAGLREEDLGRLIEGTRDGATFTRPLRMLLAHVPNHATHHRSEIATMLTMLSGSPPDTGINSYYREIAARPPA